MGFPSDINVPIGFPSEPPWAWDPHGTREDIAWVRNGAYMKLLGHAHERRAKTTIGNGIVNISSEAHVAASWGHLRTLIYICNRI